MVQSGGNNELKEVINIKRACARLPDLDEDILQNKQDCKYIHCRSKLLEFAADKIDQYISDHSDKDSI